MFIVFRERSDREEIEEVRSHNNRIVPRCGAAARRIYKR